MENKSENSKMALFEITIRVQAQNYQLRMASTGGWIALIIIVVVRVGIYFIKAAR